MRGEGGSTYVFHAKGLRGASVSILAVWYSSDIPCRLRLCPWLFLDPSLLAPCGRFGGGVCARRRWKEYSENWCKFFGVCAYRKILSTKESGDDKERENESI